MTFKTEFKTTPMEGRFAWCYLDKPRMEDMNGQPLKEPKYECAFYFPKRGADRNADPNYLFFAQLAWEVVTSVYRGQWPGSEWPIEDCDADASDVEKYPWQRGMWPESDE